MFLIFVLARLFDAVCSQLLQYLFIKVKWTLETAQLIMDVFSMIFVVIKAAFFSCCAQFLPHYRATIPAVFEFNKPHNVNINNCNLMHLSPRPRGFYLLLFSFQLNENYYLDAIPKRLIDAIALVFFMHAPKHWRQKRNKVLPLIMPRCCCHRVCCQVNRIQSTLFNDPMSMEIHYIFNVNNNKFRFAFICAPFKIVDR